MIFSETERFTRYPAPFARIIGGIRSTGKAITDLSNVFVPLIRFSAPKEYRQSRIEEYNSDNGNDISEKKDEHNDGEDHPSSSERFSARSKTASYRKGTEVSV